MRPEDLKHLEDIAGSMKYAILDDYLSFDVYPFVLRSMSVMGQQMIQTSPDYIRAAYEPITTLAGEMGDISKGLGKLTNLIG